MENLVLFRANLFLHFRQSQIVHVMNILVLPQFVPLVDRILNLWHLLLARLPFGEWRLAMELAVVVGDLLFGDHADPVSKLASPRINFKSLNILRHL